MLYGKSDTLAWFSESPYLRPINVGSTTSGVLAINCKNFMENQVKKAFPDREALDFYCMNHLMSVVLSSFTPNEKLPDWARSVATTYLDTIERQAGRMIHYMILITTRESRHVKNTSTDAFWVEFAKKFGEPSFKFNREIRGQGSTETAERFMAKPPDSEIANFISSLTHLFFKGIFGGGFGGKPWGYISQTLEHMLTGQTSTEVMLDTAYTLAHNNGPMFNKGMLYDGYTHEIYTILDVQRSGQIPELILSGEVGCTPTKEVRDCLTLVCGAKPNLFASEVDWQKVKDLGALHNYDTKIKAQEAKKPQVTKQGFPIVGKLTVMPGKHANIYLRKKAA